MQRWSCLFGDYGMVPNTSLLEQSLGKNMAHRLIQQRRERKSPWELCPYRHVWQNRGQMSLAHLPECLNVSWEVTRVQSFGLWVWLNANILVIWSISHSDSGDARTMTVYQSNCFRVKYPTSFMVTCNSWKNHFNKSQLNADMRAL